MSSERSTLVDRWGVHPRIDYIVGAGVAGGYLLFRALGGEPVVVLEPDSRAALYGVLAGAAGALLAFGITPIAIVLALTPGDRLKALLKYHNDEIRATLMAALWSLLALLVVSIVCVATDTGGASASWLRYVLLTVATVALLRTARLLRLFGLMLLDIGRDHASPGAQLHRLDMPRSERTG